MIKFVCAGCGERLSVPDAHGGRKGRCPTCQAVNLIPLKGFAETGPKAPVVARHAVTSAQTPVLEHSAGGEKISARAEESTKPPSAKTEPLATSETISETPPSSMVAQTLPESFPVGQLSESSSESQSSDVVKAVPLASLERFTSPTKVVMEPDNQAVLREIRRAKREKVKASLSDESGVDAPRKERGLPKPVKMAFLVLAALLIVGALYFALMLVLHKLVPGA